MTHLSTTLYINKLYQAQYPKVAIAGEGGIIDGVISSITGYISEHWDPERKFASIISFLGPGLLFKLGFPWMAVAYEVAGALGFDWIGIWDSIKVFVYDFVKNALDPSSAKPTEEEMHQKISSATEEALEKHVSDDKIDEEKLKKAHKLSKNAQSVDGIYLTKEAGIMGSILGSRGILRRIFGKIIPWVLTRALIALGFATAGGALRGAVGIKPKQNDGPEASSAVSSVREPIHSLQVSPNADPSLFEFNKNDKNSMWLESGNISDISNILMSWILSAFPDLAKEKDKINSSRSFIEVENMFRDRNKLARNLQIYSVPKPFQKKIEIVSYIVNGYLKTRGN